MNSTLRILVVDDNRSAADALARVLRMAGDDVKPLYDGASAIRELELEPPDLVLTDLKMSPVDGMAVLEAARRQRPPVECIVFTAYGDVDIAVKAMRIGARDFLTKPVTVEQVASRLDALRVPNSAPGPISDGSAAASPASRRLQEAIQRAASVRSRVWIEGELGSGRVFCAQTLHEAQGDGPFTILDPGQDFIWPERGTAVLPNIDDLPEDLQRNLSRRLHAVPADLRLVATASPDGRRHVTEGRLRPDLYYALAVVVVAVPPLRDRREDIPVLFQLALRRFAERYGRTAPKTSAETVDELVRHIWPGNVRELFNVAERMVVMGADRASLMVVEGAGADLPTLEPGFNLASYLEVVEHRILEEALRVSEGDRTAAGKLLGVERNTFRYKLNKYGLLDR